MSRQPAAAAPKKATAQKKAAPPKKQEPTGGSLPDSELTEVVSSIGPKIRELRNTRNLSLQQLADRSDVSPAAIHKVEQGNMVPTITTLLKLAVALERPVSYFVEEEQAAPTYVVFTPAAERKPVYTAHEGIDLEGISGPYGQYFVATAIATVEPGASSGEPALRHPGEELIHVQSGTLEVEVGDQRFRLTAGDSVHFRTDHDHRWRNPTKRPAKAVWMALRPA